MLKQYERVNNYLNQRNGGALSKKQQRRIIKKSRHWAVRDQSIYVNN